MIPRHHKPKATSLVRKAVKQIGKEAATHRFTLDEKNLLADIEYTYKRRGIRTSEKTKSPVLPSTILLRIIAKMAIPVSLQRS
jgi:hypothetical protein